jgi:hypothetical protein
MRRVLLELAALAVGVGITAGLWLWVRCFDVRCPG